MKLISTQTAQLRYLQTGYIEYVFLHLAITGSPYIRDTLAVCQISDGFCKARTLKMCIARSFEPSLEDSKQKFKVQDRREEGMGGLPEYEDAEPEGEEGEDAGDNDNLFQVLVGDIYDDL
ncbi:Protein of unknown function [Pyronema omphalodes CBS 100304]|uniref:Uncharacterized protein n=1 Tax=Pyronema omphalodes (strain CBS 100304) TaxID=1076935 RepID=U4LTZ5_PYROM|nr:Protein of unknown function [Pyronema omphalodes CBS 100304]